MTYRSYLIQKTHHNYEVPHYDLSPDPAYHPEIAILLSALDDSTREWTGELEKPTIEAITWQPAEKSHSIGACLLEIAAVEVFWFEKFLAKLPEREADKEVFLAGQWDIDNGVWPTPPAQPIEWYFDVLQSVRERSKKALQGIDPHAVFERRGDSFTARWVVAHVVEHDSYHGGQAVLLHELWKKSQ